jgi:Holliday junction resolvase RusA-like endonuclease
MSSLTFTVVGTPTPKARPRRSKHGGVYTPASTTQAEERVKKAWRDAGGYTLGDGPLSATVDAYFARPPSHYLKAGNLSAAGKRALVPGRCDADNVAKLCLDALNGLAFTDDRQVVALHAYKWWTLPRESERVVVRLRAL